ncbi:MAG: family 43 glycosylhydrolase, partial [Planctomycetota bacterium]
MNIIKKSVLAALIAVLGLAHCATAAPEVEPDSTFCNPLDLNYRFREKLFRSAADPVMVRYRGDYYLFASKAGGYWWSSDMRDWTLVKDPDIAYEHWAPAAFAHDGTLYFVSTKSNPTKIFGTSEPKNGDSWELVRKLNDSYSDGAVFVDDDGRVFLYYGCSPMGPIRVVELDPDRDFKVVSEPVRCVSGNPRRRGWEVRGDHNRRLDEKPWIEGPWMTKHDGKYYLQYAAPGTQFVSYADGVVVSDSPLGPFRYARHNPMSLRPNGFSPGAGHSATFQAEDDTYWRVTCAIVSHRAPFERRLNVFPAGFDEDGVMFSRTYMGDYPQFLPGENDDAAANNLVGWMLLTYGRPARASSTAEGHAVSKAFDESNKTYWCAESGDEGEWLQVDLEEQCSIHALQVNFAEDSTNGRSDVRDDPHQYVVEISEDGTDW